MEYDEILEAINANDIAKLQQIVTANKIDINIAIVSFLCSYILQYRYEAS